MLNRKPLIVAALGATLAVGTLSTQAYANDDALLGALVGAGIGAAIGHNVHGRDGAVVGGAIGALAGAGIAASSDSYYDARYQAALAYFGTLAIVELTALLGYYAMVAMTLNAHEIPMPTGTANPLPATMATTLGDNDQ